MQAQGEQTEPARQTDFYVTGGTIPPGSPSYAERAADRELLEALQRGELCYVLNARQMGKSSLSVRTRQVLERSGTRTAFLDLQKFGSSASAEQWYRALLERIGNDLKLRPAFLAHWRDNAELPPLTRLFSALRDVALQQIPDNLVIFLDEIDVVRDLSFKTDEFFGALRESYNARAEDPTFSRLTFCILGTVAPTDLIRDVRLSPFNIGTRVTLSDFTAAEAAPLAEPLPGGSRTLNRVLWWTSGHPYLTQRLCAELTRSQSEAVDTMVSRLFFSKSDTEVDENIKNVRNGVLRLGGDGAGFDRTDLLNRYGAIVSGQRVVDDDADGVCTALRLSGLVTSSLGLLRVRNRVYAQLFNVGWVRANLPDAEVRRQRAAVAKARGQIGSIAATILLLMSALLWRTYQAERRANAETAVANHQTYISAINSTAQNLLNLNYSAAETFLADAERFPKSERGFEWEYLQQKLHPELLTLTEPQSGVTAASFSPDGKRVVTADTSGSVCVWDLRAGKRVLTLPWHSNGVNSAVFSSDGARIIAASANNSIYVSNARTGYTLLNIQGHTAPVLSAFFSHDGTRIVSASVDDTVRVWNFATGKEQLTIHDKVASASFSSDGKRIVTINAKNTIHVWDTLTGKRLLTIQGQHSQGTSAAFSADGKRIVTASLDGLACVWDSFTGRQQLTLKGHSEGVLSASFSPDGRRIVTASVDKTVRIWDAVTGSVLLKLQGHADRILSAAFSPDGTQIITASDDRTARVWDASIGREFLTLTGHATGINSASFSKDGRRVITANDDNTARVWDLRTAKELLTLQGHWAAITSASFFSNDSRIVTASLDGFTRIWDAATGKELLTLPGYVDAVNGTAVSANEVRIVTVNSEGESRIWDAQTGKELLRLKSPSAKGSLSGEMLPSHILSAAFSADGKRIVTGGSDGYVRVWDAATGKVVLTLQGYFTRVNSALFSADGRQIVTASSDRTARVWDAATGKAVLTLRGHSDQVNSASFSGDGKRIVTAANDNTARVWDIKTGKELLTLRGHLDRVTSASFSADSKQLLTASAEGTVRVWQKVTDARGAAAMEAALKKEHREKEELQTLTNTPLASMTKVAKAMVVRNPLLKPQITRILIRAAADILDPSEPHPSSEIIQQAHEVAVAAVQYSDGHDALSLDTLAAAQFVGGDLNSALATERKAVALLPNDEDLVAALKRYEALKAQKPH